MFTMQSMYTMVRHDLTIGRLKRNSINIIHAVALSKSWQVDRNLIPSCMLIVSCMQYYVLRPICLFYTVH